MKKNPILLDSTWVDLHNEHVTEQPNLYKIRYDCPR
jgi:hypothetical protein